VRATRSYDGFVRDERGELRRDACKTPELVTAEPPVVEQLAHLVEVDRTHRVHCFPAVAQRQSTR
jgi:hypothetical protein